MPRLTKRRPIRQLTLRGFDKELDRRLREAARAQRCSLNQAALAFLRRGAGLGKPSERVNVIGHSLDHFMGTWTEKEAREFQKSIEDCERIDPEDWN